MRLVCFAEGIEARLSYHLHTRCNLLMTEGMTLAQEMFIFACSVDENRLAVQSKAMIH